MLTVQASSPFMQTADLIGPDGIPKVEPLICASGTQHFIALFCSGRSCMWYAYL